MYVKVRTMDGSQTCTVPVSKLMKVLDFRKMIAEKFDIPSERQRLFYRGKQLEDGYTLFDYDLKINDVIQLCIKPVLPEIQNNNSLTEDCNPTAKNDFITQTNCEDVEKPQSSVSEKPISDYFRVGDLVDAMYLYDGSWWEAKIVGVIADKDPDTHSEGDGLLYLVKFERYEDEDASEVKLKHIRPRAKTKVKLENVDPGDKLMVNYNVENPEERGFWFDFIVIGTLFHGEKQTSLENTHIRFVEELFKIEPLLKITQQTLDDRNHLISASPSKRVNGIQCASCKDKANQNCKECGCSVCGGKKDPALQVGCDECDQFYHIYCLNPPLNAIPTQDEWFCPECFNDDTQIVKAGEKLKKSKKKSKMASATTKSTRDWGRGMACQGRQKECTIVPKTHFGPIPGVEVGQSWKFRVLASEVGVHRPHVAGIAGGSNIGSYSLVLSGGYEDDEDLGEEFTYTGSGGRDLSGNRRTAEQSFDQTLTNMNRALALNCNTKINDKGGEASDWKSGKPVRVLRSYKGRKHSKYAPEDGVRYDGIYKVVKYWPEKGKSGFIVWRYFLRRDDPIPAPWTKEGKNKIKKFNLKMKYPDGYLEAMAEKESSASKDDEKKNIKKRSRKKTEEEFLKSAEELFLCICCQEVVSNPITTACNHNCCMSCLQRSFKANVYTCPACRFLLGKDYKINVNSDLANVLNTLFPGYDSER